MLFVVKHCIGKLRRIRYNVLGKAAERTESHSLKLCFMKQMLQTKTYKRLRCNNSPLHQNQQPNLRGSEGVAEVVILGELSIYQFMSFQHLL